MARRATKRETPAWDDEPTPNNVRVLREAAGMTQTALAEAVHISQGQLHKIEMGTRPLRIDVARRMARLFRCRYWQLYAFGDEPTQEDMALLAAAASLGPENRAALLAMAQVLHQPPAQAPAAPPIELPQRLRQRR